MIVVTTFGPAKTPPPCVMFPRLLLHHPAAMNSDSCAVSVDRSGGSLHLKKFFINCCRATKPWNGRRVAWGVLFELLQSRGYGLDIVCTGNACMAQCQAESKVQRVGVKC